MEGRREKAVYKSIYPSDVFVKFLDPVPSDLVSELTKRDGSVRKHDPSDLLDFTYSVFVAKDPPLTLTSTHRHASKAFKRLRRLYTCGREGHLSYGYLEWTPGEGLEDPPDEPVIPAVKFHPHYCKSIFCPTCWSKRVAQNNERIEFFFRHLQRQGARRATFMTLTPPSHEGFDPSLVEGLRASFRRFLSFRFTKRLRSYVLERSKEIAQEHFQSLINQGCDVVHARSVVLKHLGYVSQFLKRCAGKTVSQVLCEGLAVLEATFSRLDTGVLHCHPHLHVVCLGRIPLYVLRSLWERAGGGSVVYVEEVVGLRRLRQYLEPYLENPDGGYLSFSEGLKLTLEEAVLVEACFWGVHFVTLFGIRYRKEGATVAVVGYVYRMEGFVWRYGAYMDYYDRVLRLAVVSYGRRSWWFFEGANGFLARASPLWEEVRKDWLIQEAMRAREVAVDPEVSSGLTSEEGLDEDVAFLLENF